MAEKVREADAHSPKRWATGLATSSCLPADIVVDYSYVLAVKA